MSRPTPKAPNKAIKIKTARRVAKNHEQRAVIIIGFANGEYTVTSYGKNRTLCEAAQHVVNAIAHKIDMGTLPIPEPLQS